MSAFAFSPFFPRTGSRAEPGDRHDGALLAQTHHGHPELEILESLGEQHDDLAAFQPPDMPVMLAPTQAVRNCASSVEPLSASVDAVPPEMTSETRSK